MRKNQNKKRKGDYPRNRDSGPYFTSAEPAKGLLGTPRSRRIMGGRCVARCLFFEVRVGFACKGTTDLTGSVRHRLRDLRDEPHTVHTVVHPVKSWKAGRSNSSGPPKTPNRLTKSRARPRAFAAEGIHVRSPPRRPRKENFLATCS